MKMLVWQKMLVYLLGNSGKSMTEIHYNMKKSMTYISMMMKELKRKGYVRIVRPDKSKEKRVYLTSKGKRLATILKNAAEAM